MLFRSMVFVLEIVNINFPVTSNNWISWMNCSELTVMILLVGFGKTKMLSFFSFCTEVTVTLIQALVCVQPFSVI